MHVIVIRWVTRMVVSNELVINCVQRDLCCFLSNNGHVTYTYLHAQLHVHDKSCSMSCLVFLDITYFTVYYLIASKNINIWTCALLY